MRFEEDSDKSTWGRLLYQDSTGMKDNMENRVLAMAVGVIFGLIFIGMGFWPGPNLMTRILIVVSGIVSIGVIPALHALVPQNPFQIYEKGIRFTDRGNFVLFFSDINHIKVGKFGDLEIFSKGGNRYTIAEPVEPAEGITECPRNFGKVSKLVQERMRACNAGRNQHYIVRDLYRIKWSKEAFHKLKLRWGPGPGKNAEWALIADRVAAAGRRRVELADVNARISELGGQRP